MKDRKDIYHFDRSLRRASALVDKSTMDQRDRECARTESNVLVLTIAVW